MRRVALCLVIGLLMVVGCARTQPGFPADSTQSDTTTDIGAARQDPAEARLLSAFFGLDNGLPLPANAGICPHAGGADGMPVIFSTEVDAATMQAGDFRVTTQSGQVGQIYCVTLGPALDPGEHRTALLVGEFGSAATDPPARVEIVGNLLSINDALNFKGASIAVTPLAPGPTLVLAEVVPESQWNLGRPGGPRGTGSGCPAAGTRQVVRAVWAGGVTVAGGQEAGDAERALYRVTLRKADGGEVEVVPFALADLGDGDNNHMLCLDVDGAPVRVSFPAGHLADPNGDFNPDTSVALP
jgi:hypothetical protein